MYPHNYSDSHPLSFLSIQLIAAHASEKQIPTTADEKIKYTEFRSLQNMYISRVKVLNFRSLADVEIYLNEYTALVGLNDTGKSNLLRALNLFFNGQTDIGQSLDFVRDFSQQKKKIKGKAREITVEVEFSPPANYADKVPVVWIKNYRDNSNTPYSEEFKKADGTNFSKGSRTEYWVKNLKFEYVPAIRGNAFFTILKRRLYTTLATTVATKLTAASGAFLAGLRQELKNIESESKRLLDLQTEFSLPIDLGGLFEILDFDASDPHSKTPLQNRGDGVQGRHVSVILKFLADQRKINSAKGKPPEETIWGFEEPENNLELIKQIEVAAEFEAYSSSIQIIVSTHSPAFYGAALEKNGVRIAKRELGRTTFASNLPAESIDEHLGLMPFIQPYLELATRERNKLVEAVKSLEESALLHNRPAIFVEGSTDKRIIEAVFKALKRKINFEIVAKPGMGAGANWVAGCCVARAAMTDLKEKTAALFDDDQAGNEGVANVQKRCAAIGRPNQIKTFIVGKSNGDDEIRTLKKKKINIPVGIEELCGQTVWVYAEANGWLIEREDLVTDNVHLLRNHKDKTLSGVLDNLIGDNLHLLRLVEYKLKAEHKGTFSKYMETYLEQYPPPPTLAALAQTIEDYFNPSPQG